VFSDVVRGDLRSQPNLNTSRKYVYSDLAFLVVTSCVHVGTLLFFDSEAEGSTFL
jgi:hypothetical protein